MERKEYVLHCPAVSFEPYKDENKHDILVHARTIDNGPSIVTEYTYKGKSKRPIVKIIYYKYNERKQKDV